MASLVLEEAHRGRAAPASSGRRSHAPGTGGEGEARGRGRGRRDRRPGGGRRPRRPLGHDHVVPQPVRPAHTMGAGSGSEPGRPPATPTSFCARPPPFGEAGTGSSGCDPAPVAGAPSRPRHPGPGVVTDVGPPRSIRCPSRRSLLDRELGRDDDVRGRRRVRAPRFSVGGWSRRGATPRSDDHRLSCTACGGCRGTCPERAIIPAGPPSRPGVVHGLWRVHRDLSVGCHHRSRPPPDRPCGGVVADVTPGLHSIEAESYRPPHRSM